MGTSKAEGKRSLKEMEQEEEEDQDDEDMSTAGGLGFGEDDKIKKKGKRASSGGSTTTPPGCQVQNCRADMTTAKRYHRRHKVCESHSKVPVVRVAGLEQRFCQQCSRFHEVSEFDEAKRSCRRRLAGHNERRRRSSSENHGEVSN